MTLLADLGPLAQLRAGRLPRRLVQLYAGLLLYGVSLAMLVRAGLGAAPWDVLHLGLATHLPMTLGQALILTSVLVMVLWIPLRELPGLGTISNAIVIGLAAVIVGESILPSRKLVLATLAVISTGLKRNSVPRRTASRTL